MLVLEHGLGKITSHKGEHVFLLPGQWYFGGTGSIVRTLLGSCVALTLWHPQRRLGGMCHYLLPARTRAATAALDGRFAEEAVHMLVESIARTGTKPADYLVDLYGGADTMPEHLQQNKFNIGERNIEKALELVDRYGFQLMTVDVGGNEPRNVTLDMKTGQVELRRGKPHGAAVVDSSHAAPGAAPHSGVHAPSAQARHPAGHAMHSTHSNAAKPVGAGHAAHAASKAGGQVATHAAGHAAGKTGHIAPHGGALTPRTARPAVVSTKPAVKPPVKR